MVPLLVIATPFLRKAPDPPAPAVPVPPRMVPLFVTVGVPADSPLILDADAAACAVAADDGAAVVEPVALLSPTRQRHRSRSCPYRPEWCRC